MSVRFHATVFALLVTARSIFKTQATNSYPIVLVGGFFAWSRDELSGFRYWGGIQGDFQNELTARGYTVYTAAVGPFSSNWDRACELYALIKGGQVDYGQNHSATHNHLRFGRNYTGLYTRWGTVNADGSINKVHIMGHSMGGQTARMLTQMLEHGTGGAPIEEDPSSHPLFSGGKSWVHSITTISTPNQGTTLADGFSVIGDSVKDLLAGVLSVVGIFGTKTEMFYDAKLDQWGIASKQPGEMLKAYLNRVYSSSIFDPSFRDFSLWSLSTRGAKEEATWVTILSDVYYYSYTTVATFETRDWFFRKISLPHLLSVTLALAPSAVFVGGRYAPDVLKLPTEWQPNDGVVNSISMASDGIGSVVAFTGSSHLGTWNLLPQLNRLDHLGMIGFTLHTQVLKLYEGHAALLASLPTTSGARRLQSDSIEARVKLDTAIEELSAATARVGTKTDLEALCQDPKNAYVQNYCTKMLASVATRHLRG
uniref:Lipase-like C-terminal domain-containing protein n=1 Tax=Peronospora matthiolae TaxID=2874970 RepID=A0AAV1UF14_9STRA